MANQAFYQLNPAETGALITFANDLFYYNWQRPRLRCSGPQKKRELPVEGRMVSFVRGGNLYVEDLSTQRRRAPMRDNSDKILTAA